MERRADGKSHSATAPITATITSTAFLAQQTQRNEKANYKSRICSSTAMNEEQLRLCEARPPEVSSDSEDGTSKSDEKTIPFLR
jgi:hypothetical protein